MNTNSINTISKYLLLFLLILTGASCNDNDDAEDTSIPVLISQNINDGDVVGPSGYVELTFSKAMRQAPDTEIYFNGGVVRVSINYEKVRYTFSGMENKECTFEVPAGALTDMQGRAYDEDFFLSFTAKSEISGGGKVITLLSRLQSTPSLPHLPVLIKSSLPTELIMNVSGSIRINHLFI